MTANVPTVLRTLYRKVFCLEEWNIGTIALPSGGVKELFGRERLGTVSWCVSTPRYSFIADPFIWAHPDSPRVLVEEFDYRAGRGRVKSLSFEGLQCPEATKDEIALPFHASYPFVFPFADSWYCIPECAESSAVDLYVWNSATGQWQFDSRLLHDLAVYDPTLLVQDGIWYLFGTLRDDGPQSKLRIWFADSLRGPWQSHPMNPVRIAPDQVRPAGPLFSIEGCLYRPSQDCRRGYGSGIILNRIEYLTPSRYRETPVREWQPQKDSLYSQGLHTISFTATAAIVDGKRFRFTPFAVFWKSWWKIMKRVRRAAVARHTPTSVLPRHR